ncbi:MAG: alanine dehydrogenase, partial [Actinomycetota bacterium]
AVGNMPGAVPHTSTYALTNATLPYLLSVAKLGTKVAAQNDPRLRLGVNTVGGEITNGPAAEALGKTAVDCLKVL